MKKLLSKRPSSLRAQLLVRMLLILSFILFIIGIFQYFVMKEFLYNNEAESLQARLMSMPVERMINDGMFPEPPEQGEPDSLFVEEYSLALIESGGDAINLLGEEGLAPPQLSDEEYQEVLENMAEPSQIQHQIIQEEKGREQLMVFRPAAQNPRNIESSRTDIIQMGVSTSPLQQVLWRQLLTFITLSLLALLGGLVIYFSVIRRTLRPLSNIVEAVQHIDATRLNETIPGQQGQEEMDRLSESFNQMLQRLERSFEYEKETKEQMRRFIADASHELRTPITSVHGYLEVLMRGAANNPEQLSNALYSMHGETKRVIKLVEELLLLAKLDQTPELQLKRTDIHALVWDMKPQLTFLAGDRNTVFTLAEEVDAECDEDKIRQVILNLFYNAVDHTDAEHGKIVLFLEKAGSHVKLTIEDNGPGIREANLPHIFDRFYRADPSRTRKRGGAGLGLAISKAIIEAHHGKISVKSKEGEGTTFIVMVPVTPRFLSN
ncbi:sensor histidine kinase [Salibacterium aidingense]|uniref:sensor histidine kinase n=1 Tax=Salibacterium aidingense TaxID=384933 RepID=UPI003BBBA4B4